MDVPYTVFTHLLDAGDRLNISIEPRAFVFMMGAAALMAALLGAVLMVLAIPSRTYREGQATLSPFYLLTMVPGMIVVTSHASFGMTYALVPVLNGRKKVSAPSNIVVMYTSY